MSRPALSGRQVRERLALLARAVRRDADRLRRPGSTARTEATQIAKATVAAIIAWYLTSEIMGSRAAWLAPAVAVLMVHSTVYRSLQAGVKRVAAVLAGALIAAAAGTAFGLSSLGLLVVVPLSLIGARLRWIRAQGEYITTTAVLLLTFGVATNEFFLRAYVLDTAIGCATGALVNVLLFPPAYQRSARGAIGDLATDVAELLRDLAGGLRSGWHAATADEWRRRADGLRGEAASSALAWSQEGLRWNPWPKRDGAYHPRYYEPAVDMLRHVAIEVQDFTRTLQEWARRRAADGDRADGPEDLLAAAPPLHDNLAPMLESVAEVIDSFGEDPAVRGGGLSEPVADALAQAEQRYQDMSQRVPTAGIADLEPFTVAGSAVQATGRIVRHLRELDQRPA